jgi:hypothetical protein
VAIGIDVVVGGGEDTPFVVSEEGDPKEPGTSRLCRVTVLRLPVESVGLAMPPFGITGNRVSALPLIR